MAPFLDDGGPLWHYEDQRLLFSFLPRRCRKSGESIWFKKAYRCRFYDWSGHEDRWFCQEQYLWKMLKDT